MDDCEIIAFTKWHVYTTAGALETHKDAGSRSLPSDYNVPCLDDLWSKLQVVQISGDPARPSSRARYPRL